MTIRQLSVYNMSQIERIQFENLEYNIRDKCKDIVPKKYQSVVENYISEIQPYQHKAGFCLEDGYFYIEDGDRGERSLLIKTNDYEEILLFYMKKILTYVGQSMELEVREQEELKGIRDSRKWWFEYLLRGLISIFGSDKMKPVIEDYTDSMNYWFDDRHWDFNIDSQEFVEISNSKERDSIADK